MYHVPVFACSRVEKQDQRNAIKGELGNLLQPVNEAHGVDPIQSQHHLGCVKAGPLLRDVIVAHQVNQVATGHVFHHHVEVAIVLKSEKELWGIHGEKYLVMNNIKENRCLQM